MALLDFFNKRNKKKKEEKVRDPREKYRIIRLIIMIVMNQMLILVKNQIIVNSIYILIKKINKIMIVINTKLYLRIIDSYIFA